MARTPHKNYALLCSSGMKLRSPDADAENEGDEKEGDEKDDDEKEGDEKEEGGEEEEDGGEVAKLEEKAHEAKLETEGGHEKHEAEEDPEQAKLREALVAAHQALANNMKRRVEIGIELRGLATSNDLAIDTRVADVANETSPALAHLLGDMWKEQRRFEMPLYEEHLESEAAELEKEAVELERKYEEAKKADAAHTAVVRRSKE